MQDQSSQDLKLSYHYLDTMMDSQHLEFII